MPVDPVSFIEGQLKDIAISMTPIGDIRDILHEIAVELERLRTLTQIALEFSLRFSQPQYPKMLTEDFIRRVANVGK